MEELEHEITFIDSGISYDDLIRAGASYDGSVDILDEYYVSELDGSIYRLRKQDRVSYLQTKSTDASNDSTKLRTERGVVVGNDFNQMAEQLGLKKKVSIEKPRKNFKLYDMLISISDTDKLGSILDIEFHSRQDLDKLLSELHLDPKNAEKRSTYTLLKEKVLHEYDSMKRGLEALIEEIVQRRDKHIGGGPLIVAVGGESGSGKSFVSGIIANAVGGSVLGLDNYYKDGAWEIAASIGNNFDHPMLMDFDLIDKHLRELRIGNSVMMPAYSFKTGNREGSREFTPTNVVIVEGIFALTDRLRALGVYDLTVGVLSDTHRNLIRRLIRDVARTKFTGEQILDQMANTVVPMSNLYVLPGLRTADFKLVNDYNAVASLEPENQYKFRVDDFKLIEDQLASSFEKLTQENISDSVLVPKERHSLEEVLYVRRRNGKTVLSASFLEHENGSLRKYKYEVYVNANAVANLIATGAYELIGVINKSRETYSRGGVVVKLDDVQDAGKFIEICTHDREAAINVMTELGLKPESTIINSYAELVLGHHN